MSLKDFLFTFFKSLNPDAYKDIIHRSMLHTALYFMTLVLFCIILSGAVFFATTPNMSKSIDDRLAKVEKLNISVDVKLKEPVTIWKNPLVVADFTGNRSVGQKEAVLITDKAVFVRKFSPGIKDWKFYMYRIEETQLSRYSNVMENRDLYKGLFSTLLLILLPSVIFVLFIMYCIKYMLLVGLAIGIAAIVMRIRGRELHTHKLFNTGIYSSTPMVFLGIVVDPFFRLGIIPQLIFAVLFIVGLMMTSEKEFHMKERIFNRRKGDDEDLLR